MRLERKKGWNYSFPQNFSNKNGARNVYRMANPLKAKRTSDPGRGKTPVLAGSAKEG